MVRTCPSCGTVTVAEVRFCRHCGASLKAVAAASENEQISPIAQTVPLSGEGLTTSSLGADDVGGTASETKRVGRAEMEHLFSHTRFENSPESQRDGDSSSRNVVGSDYAAPQTGELARPVSGGAQASSARTAHAPAINRSRRPRVLMVGLLLLVTLSGALVAYYFLRHRSTEKTSAAPVASNSNQAIENSNQAVESSSAASPVEETPAGTVVEPPPQTEETARPQPSVESPRDARARQERERAAPSPVAAIVTPSPEASLAPVAQATPTPQSTPVPTPSPAVVNRNAAQTNSDDFYFQAVNLVNGRDPRTLQRAELVRALQLFLNVKSGPHLGEAARQADRLGRELDRRRKQERP